MPAESLTLEQQLAQYPLFNQLTAQAQAQLLSDLQKQQQALSQGIQLITLPTLASPGTASASSPSPDSQSQTTASISVNSVRDQKVEAKITVNLTKWYGPYYLFFSFFPFSPPIVLKALQLPWIHPYKYLHILFKLLGFDTDLSFCRIN